MKRYYGWKPQFKDQRDFLFYPKEILLPPLIDLRDKCPSVYDQGQLGSCTANGIGFAYEFDHLKQGLGIFMPSRLFIYYNERVIEGSVKYDNGASIRDGFKTINKQGVCSESLWPYIIRKFAKKPCSKCYNEAKKDLAVQYKAVNQSLTDIKSCLVEGFPVVVGISIYESFESDEVAKSGIVPMPGTNESLLGGHCIAVVGYDDNKRIFIMRNSWGEGWGEKGYFYLPYNYLISPNLASDFWSITLVE